MPTTARGIWTPSDTDAVDFTTHLATMAGTIDTAITNGLNTIGAGSNAFKGTAAQRAAFLSTAVNGMLWQDTDSIKMIWRKDGAVWVPAVWRWSGTTAQMNAFTQAPNGFEWFNTTDNSDYVRFGGSWRGGVATITAASGSALAAATGVMLDQESGTVSGGVFATRSLWTAGGATTIATVSPAPGAAHGCVVAFNGTASPFIAFGQISLGGQVIAHNSPPNGQSWTASISFNFKAAGF